MNEPNSCVICYENNNPSNALSCCDNTKKMCDDCLNCLRSPLCPYCREPLSKEMLSSNIHVQSAPTTTTTNDWTTMLHDELLINPYDPEFQDSRILRRQIRRMRRRFLSEQNRNRNRNRTNENRITSRTRRANRRAERHFLRNSVRLNNRNSNLQFELEL